MEDRSETILDDDDRWVIEHGARAVLEAWEALGDRERAEQIVRDVLVNLLCHRQFCDLEVDGEAVLATSVKNGCDRYLREADAGSPRKTSEVYEAGATVDGQALLSTVHEEIEEKRQRRDSGGPETDGLLFEKGTRPLRRFRFTAALKGLCLAVIVAVAWSLVSSRSSTDVKGLIERIAAGLDSPIERVYRVSWRSNHLNPRPLSTLLSGKECLLYTRGDCFVAHPTDREIELVWGKSPGSKDHWVAFPGLFGLRFDPDSRLGKRVDLLVELGALDLCRLLDRLGGECDFSVVETDGDRRINAVPKKAEHPFLGLSRRPLPFKSASLRTAVGSDIVRTVILRMCNLKRQETGVLRMDLDESTAPFSTENHYVLSTYLHEGDPVVEGDDVGSYLARLGELSHLQEPWTSRPEPDESERE